MPRPAPPTASATRPMASQPGGPGISGTSGAAALPPGLGLRYVSDDMPGLSRLKAASGFRYRNAKGEVIKDADEIRRINKLAIPPAYERVWICPQHNGHLQATGYDARGRKQYRYHADWQSHRNDSKFERLQAFGLALPRIRARVARDLVPTKNQPLGRTLVLATLVRLLDTTYVRVGNDAYARENGSYGLTTLRNPHAGVRGSTLRLRFRGKSGVMQDLKVDDPKVAAVVRRCQQLPGQLLFQYEDEAGELHAVDSSDVNDYLSEIVEGRRNEEKQSSEEPPRAGDGPLDGQRSTRSGQPGAEHFTAKDFRTWHGTAQALELTRLACNGNAAAAYNAKDILKEVARQLGNTPAVCKKSYIHPAVMSLGTELTSDAGAMMTIWDKLSSGKTTRRLQAAEARLLAFLKAHQRHNSKRGVGKKTAGKPTISKAGIAKASKTATSSATLAKTVRKQPAPQARVKVKPGAASKPNVRAQPARQSGKPSGPLRPSRSQASTISS